MIKFSCYYWDIENSSTDFTQTLHPEELRRGEAYQSGRRLMFCTGRLAAKNALLGLDSTLTPSQIWIDSDPRGKPYLKQPDLPYFVSISHTRGAAFAAASINPQIGVDIEPFSEKRGEVVWKKLTPHERSLYRREWGSRSLFSLRLWTAKESALKAASKGAYVFNETYEISSVTVLSTSLFKFSFRQLSGISAWVDWDLSWIKGTVISDLQTLATPFFHNLESF